LCHRISEYDNDGNELAHFIYGPGIDEPIATWSSAFLFGIDSVENKIYNQIMKTGIKSVGTEGEKHRNEGDVSSGIGYEIDITMLADNINRTVDERIRRHQIALNTVEKLRKAKFV